MKTLIVLLLISIPCFGTYGSRMQWDVQTTGADTRGAGFDVGVASPGTDESMGAGTAITISLTAATTGTCSPACSSTTHGPGNVIYIASGTGCTLATRYEILSISGSTITVDRNMGSNGNSCVGTIGGSAATYGAIIQIEADGNSIWIQSGTYTQTTGVTVPGGNRTSPRLVGYQTTHGDNGTRPLLTTATNSVNLITTGNSNPDSSFSATNIAFSNTAGTRGKALAEGTNADFIQFVNCTFDGFSRAIDLSVGGSFGFLFHNSSIINDQGSGIYYTHGVGGAVTNSYFYNNVNGIEIAAAANGADSLAVVNSIFDANTTNGILIDNGQYTRLVVTDSTFSGSGANGIGFSGTTTNALFSNITIQGNIFYGNTGYGLQVPTTWLKYNYIADHNGWGGNNGAGTGLSYPSQIAAGTGDVTFGATPFTSAAGHDFSLNATTNGGALARSTGVPGAFTSSSTTGYHDIGAVTGYAPGAAGGVAGGAFVQ